MRGGRAVAAVAMCAGALAIVAAAALAAAGQLDSSFSGNGKRVTDFNAGEDEGSGVAIQQNGRIVVVGSSDQTASGMNFAIARYMPNGSLDSSFSGDGKRSISFLNGTDLDEGDAVAIQPNGRIVVAGTSDQGMTTGTDFAVARLMPNGSLDSSFSGDGKQLTSFDAGFDEGQGVAIQADGKIVVAGVSAQGTQSYFAVARYRPNGNPDTSFSGDGKRTASFGPGGFDEGDTPAIQSNGRIVVAGSSQGGMQSDFAIARFLPGGTLDTSFSSDGKRTVTFGGGFEEGDDLAIQRDGKVVVVGATDEGQATSDFGIARLRPNGSLDNGFSGDGKRRIVFGAGQDNGNGVAIQLNGRLVVAGSSDRGVATGVDFATARLRSNGSLDAGFSGDGKRITTFGTGKDEGDDVAIQPNGRIVVAGLANGDTAASDFAIARFLAN